MEHFKYFLLIALLPLVLTKPAHGQTYYVCSTGSMENGADCGFRTLQAAVNAAPDGATIVMRSGDTTGPIVIPGGRHDLTVKSSKIDSYPRGYRIVRNDPSLARIVSTTGVAPVTIGNEFKFGVPQLGANTITFSAPHGFVVGDRVSLSGARYSPYYCASANMPPFGSTQCPADRVGFFMVRGYTNIQNGYVLYVRGAKIPTPLQPDTPYYVVNFTQGGNSSTTPDKFQIANAPGGNPIVLGSDYVYNGGLTFEFSAAPARMYDALYVASVPSNNAITLSREPGGPPIGPWTQRGSGYDGGTTRPGIQVIKVAATRNITFDGFEITHDPDNDPWMLVYLTRDWTHPDGEHSGFRMLRCWVHGDDDQESLPHQGIFLSARDSEVGWSIVEGIWSNFADTQAIAITNTNGNIDIHDNFLSATGEVIMSGGNTPSYLGTQAKGIRVRRNYLYKPLNWWTGIGATYVNNSTFDLTPRMAGTSCAAQSTATNLSNKCFWYEGTTRYELSQDVRITLTGASGAGRIVIYGEGGRIKLRHNTNGAVTCPSQVECAYTQKPAFPPGSARMTLIPITNGQIPSSLWIDNRPPWVKNALESKTGDNWLVEGNVFHREYIYPGGLGQDMLINITNGVNGSGDLEPVNYFVSSSDMLIRNNIFRHAGKGIVGIGKSYSYSGATARYEAAGVGRADRNRIDNNLFVDIGSSEWNQATRGPVVQNQWNNEWTVTHNTAVDVRHSLSGNGASSNVDISANVFIPYLAANPALDTPSYAAALGDGATCWNNLTAAYTGPQYDSLSRFGRNMLMNRNGYASYTTRGVHYPASPNDTYLVQATDPGRDPNLLFQRWIERSGGAVDASGSNYRASDFRLKTSETSKYPTYSGRVIGADMDEIEALTGPFGKDVEDGVPEFGVRTSRQIVPSNSSAIVTYLASSDTCTLRIWNNGAYSGAPASDINDSAGTVINGLRSVSLSGLLPGTTYFGKRWCGSSVDVFSFTTGSGMMSSLAQRCSGETCSTAAAASPRLSDRPDTSSDNGEDYLVQFSSGLSKEQLALLNGQGIHLKKTFFGGLIALMTLSDEQKASLAAEADVVSISPDRPVHPTSEPSTAAGASIAMASGWSGKGVGIAVVDSGVSEDAFLAARGSRLVYAESFVPNEPDTADVLGHGTRIARVIAGQGPAGVAVGAHIINLRVFDSHGAGRDSAVIGAIERAVSLKETFNIRIINLSLGRPVFESYVKDPLCRAVEEAWKAGVVVIAAAGSGGRVRETNGYQSITAPGNDPFVITVGALNGQNIDPYSSRGPSAVDHIVKPDIVAPGFIAVHSAHSNAIEAAGRLTKEQLQEPVGGGTSVAAAVVSAGAALLLEREPRLSPDAVKAILMLTATKAAVGSGVYTDPLTNYTYTVQHNPVTVGAGFLDIWSAINNSSPVPGRPARSPKAAWNATQQRLDVVQSPDDLWAVPFWEDTAVWGEPIFTSGVLLLDAPLPAAFSQGGTAVTW